MALSSARGKLIGVIGDEVGILGLYWLVFTIHLQDHSFQDTYLFFINQLCSLGVGIHPVHPIKNYGQNQLVRRVSHIYFSLCLVKDSKTPFMFRLREFWKIWSSCCDHPRYFQTSASGCSRNSWGDRPISGHSHVTSLADQGDLPNSSSAV